jgi:hypothetical protein
MLKRPDPGKFGEKLEFRRDLVPACPVCFPRCTYGPLTEEMVAEALWVAADPDQGHFDDDNTRQARFVLRLLHQMFNAWSGWGAPGDLRPAHDWHKELMDLARQK